MLYSTLGAHWTYDSRITFSFMPDGTSVGGVPSALFQNLNAKYATATWENQIEQAASLWEDSANVNLAPVADGGQPVGTNGNQQDDPRFGDIRIGAIPLPNGILAETFVPPPINGGTDAGDILLNSNINWQIGGGFDLMTVTAHEFGHALGLGESTDPNSVMYGTYNGPKNALDSDDVAGIQSIYGAPQFDQFNNSGRRNSTVFTSTNITSYINGSGQAALSNLANTYAADAEWYSITVPSPNSGTMVVTLQSSNLSSLAPTLDIYNSSQTLISQVSGSTTYGATLTAWISVSAGQKYSIRVGGLGSYGYVGAYGLKVNFSTQLMSPIAPPNTVVAQQPDQGGGSETNAITAPSARSSNSNSERRSHTTQDATQVTIGSLSGWVAMMYAPVFGFGPAATESAAPIVQPGQSTGTVGAIGALDASVTALSDPGTTSGTTGNTTAAPLVSTIPAGSTSDFVLQAVDATLLRWKGHRGRATAISKIRATHWSDHL